MLKTVGNQGASIQHGTTRIKCLNWPLNILPESWTEPEELKLEEETCNLSETSMDG